MPKVNCPFHEDSTASLHIYPEDERYYCYGCGRRGNIKELDVVVADKPFKSFKASRPENLEASLARIRKLPTKNIRSLVLNFDVSGYYVVYPNTPYYIRRVWDDKDPNRYRSPYGVPKPLLTYPGPNNTLFVIEGQINTLSAQSACPQFSYMCPGSAVDLNKLKSIQYCLQYTNICIMVDKDAAGVAAGIALKNTLLTKNKNAVLVAMPEDFNQLLDMYGKEKVKEELENAISMLRVRGNKENV